MRNGGGFRQFCFTNSPICGWSRNLETPRDGGGERESNGDGGQTRTKHGHPRMTKTRSEHYVPDLVLLLPQLDSNQQPFD